LGYGIRSLILLRHIFRLIPFDPKLAISARRIVVRFPVPRFWPRAPLAVTREPSAFGQG